MKLQSVFAFFALLLAGSNALPAQSLTPEQQQRLNSLPPALRAQALEELRRLPNMQRSQSQPLTQPELITPLDSSNSQDPLDPHNLDRVRRPITYQPELISTEERAEVKAVEEELEPFGYDLFAGVPTSFAPATDIPVPTDYIVGPGDQVRLQLYGKQTASYELYVSRDGVLQIPELGPIPASGQRFSELRTEISRRVSEQMIGVQAYLTMGELRSVRIFVLGDVNRPGSYTISSLSTMTNALFLSGGVKTIGSLRNIQLKRAGEIVAELDLYDLLLRGDTSQDARLQPGDVLFIPPVGPLVGVAGEVNRPAIYELKGGETMQDLIRMAGGFKPSAYPVLSQVERIAGTGSREILDVDLTDPEKAETSLRNGDTLRIFPTLERVENYVRLEGAVQRPGDLQWYDGLNVLHVIPSHDLLLSSADLKYTLIVSKNPVNGDISTRSFSLEKLFSGEQPPLRLQKEDRIIVFNSKEFNQTEQDIREEERGVSSRQGQQRPRAADTTRQSLPNQPIEPNQSIRNQDNRSQNARNQDNRSQDTRNQRTVEVSGASGERNQPGRPELEEVIERLRLQGTSSNPQRIVEITGRVRQPGSYPLDDEMTVADLLQAAGGFTEDAYTLEAELLRFVDNDKTLRESILLPINLTELEVESTSDLALQPFDQLMIKRIPEWSAVETIEIRGEVRFPGTYAIERGESLDQILTRAGGLTDLAFPEAAIFLRESLRISEAEQLSRLRDRLREDVTASRLQSEQFTSSSLDIAQGLLSQLETIEPVGRLVIDLPKIIEEGASPNALRIRDGDELIIPQRPQSVTVIGSVNYPTSHLHQSSLGRDDYLGLSGGLLQNADKRRIYVVRANGQVVAEQRSRFFPRGSVGISAGDTIVVPLDVDRVRPLKYWADISQIVYQIALGAAAVRSL